LYNEVNVNPTTVRRPPFITRKDHTDNSTYDNPSDSIMTMFYLSLVRATVTTPFV